MAPKRARVPSVIAVTTATHPFMLFPSVPAYRERCQGMVGRFVTAGRTLDWAAVRALGVEPEIQRMFSVLPYSRAFTITEPTYLELVCEFYASYTYQREQVTFRLGGIDRTMSIDEFGVALGVWQPEELSTPAYTTAVRDFTSDVSIAWGHICATGVPYQHGTAKASGIYPALRYLHVIVCHTFAGRRTAPGTVTQAEAFLLSHMHRGIAVDMGRFIAIVMRGFATDARKQCLALGPFITRVARYLELDIEGAELTQVAPSTVPIDLTVLRNMGMVVRDSEGRYTIQSEQPGEPSQEQQEQSTSSAPPYAPRTAFERHLLQRIDRLEDRHIQDMANLDSWMRSVDSRLSHIDSQVGEMHRHYTGTSQLSVEDFDIDTVGPEFTGS